MIDRDAVVKEVSKVLEDKGESEMQFLQRACPATVKWLRTVAPDFWRNYGPYWWNMREVLTHHAPREMREYATALAEESSDDETREQFDYGSDVGNYVAAQMYLEHRAATGQLGADTSHIVNDREYIPGVGFVDEDASAGS
jgi:hypothetical protein